MLDGATLQMHGKGGGGDIHTRTKVWINPRSLRTNAETLITGKMHIFFCELSKGRERRKVLLSFPAENSSCARWSHGSCRFAQHSWERLGTTDVIKEKKKKKEKRQQVQGKIIERD